MDNYTNSLRAHNLKVTPQRLAIVDALHVRGHMNIDEIYELLLNKFNTISLATIYKNINLMVQNSFVQEVKIPYTKSVYELTKESHSHLVCTECGKIEDINIDLDCLDTQIAQKSAYAINELNLVLSGVCEQCQ